MTGRVRVRELMRRQGLSGEIVRLFHSQRTGIIHGDDGYDVAFSEEAPVVGLGYPELGLGLKVSYGVFFATGSKVPTAIKRATCVRRSNRVNAGRGKFSFGKSRWIQCGVAPRVGRGAEEPPLVRERHLSPIFRNTQERMHEGSDLPRLSKTGERHDSWR